MVATPVWIHRPAKTAMQSGQGKTKEWVLQFEPVTPRDQDPLTGWTSSADTLGQVRLRFATQEEAIAYAKRRRLEFLVVEPKAKTPPRPKSYADNFRYDRPA